MPPGRTRIDDQEVISKRHSTIAQIIEHRLLEEPMESLYKVTTVRNPFDSMVSMWVKLRHRPSNFVTHKVHDRELGFAEYIAQFWGDQPEQSMHAHFVEGVDEVMRFETLQQDLARVLAHVGAPLFEIPRINPTTQKNRHYSEYYEPATREVIERVFRPDLEQFGYAFETG